MFGFAHHNEMYKKLILIMRMYSANIGNICPFPMSFISLFVQYLASPFQFYSDIFHRCWGIGLTAWDGWARVPDIANTNTDTNTDSNADTNTDTYTETNM